MTKLTAVIIARNEEANLPRCLASLKWVDEIIVVDCGSRDGTERIALKYTSGFHYRAWDNFSRQKAHALALASHEWVLSLDADERVSKELAEEMREAVGSGTRDGYFIRRDNYFLGKLMTGAGWQNDYQMRLFRKSRAAVTDRLVHEGFEIGGTVGRLSNPLQHLTCASLSAAFQKMNEYTSLEAIEYAGSRKGSAGAAVMHSFSAFLRSYVARKGYRDGAHGLILSLLNAATTMLLYMKIWEIQRNEKTKAPLIR